MASIEEIYKKSEYAKIANTNKDKTPLSATDTKLQKSDTAVEKARGGKLLEKKYSDSVKK